MRSLLSLLAVIPIAAMTTFCSSSSDNNHDTTAGSDAGADAVIVTPPPPPPPDDGGPGPLSTTPTSITITTTAQASSQTSGGKTNATWAAYRQDDGSWTALAPTTTTGTYKFDTKAARWAVAFACANDQNALVAIHEEVVAITTMEIPLESWCAPPPTDFSSVTGTLSNVPATTSWLDFGYPLESRGVALGVAGTNADYEEINIVAGTWDLAFGLRDDSGQALTKIALVRSQALTVDATLNVDIGGASSFTPVTKKLAMHGIDPTENLSLPVLYTTGGGAAGLDLGPQSVTAAADINLTYATIPVAMQIATDRYRATFNASTAQSSRDVSIVLHDAVDFDITLLPLLDGVTASIAATTPYIRVTTNVPTKTGMTYYESSAVARVSDRSSIIWRMSTSVAALGTNTTATFTTPDFSAIAGWKADWTLPADTDRNVSGTMREAPTTLSDGTMTRSTSHIVTLAAQ